MHMIRLFSLVLLLAAIVSGCARRESAEEQAAAPDSSAAAEVAAEPAPPPEVAGIRVDVSLTPAAASRLQSDGESIRIEVTYGGDPAPAASGQVNELGMVELGKVVRELQ